MESTQQRHAVEANRLLAAIARDPVKSFRIGFTGAPGVGKSTFIEAMGTHVLNKQHRLAVLVSEINC